MNSQKRGTVPIQFDLFVSVPAGFAEGYASRFAGPLVPSASAISGRQWLFGFYVPKEKSMAAGKGRNHVSM